MDSRITIAFPDGTERVLVRHDDEMNMAVTHQKLLDVFSRSLDPEERFQIGLYRENPESGETELGFVHVTPEGTVHHVQWMRADVRFGRTPQRLSRSEVVVRLNRLADSLTALQDGLNMVPAALDGVRRMIDEVEPATPLERGNRTLIDRLQQKYPELRGATLVEYRFVPPQYIDDLALLSIAIKTENCDWKEYRLELVP